MQRCDLMVNLSASPWHDAKGALRQNVVVADAARSLGCPVAYVNCVGGNDELIFDGRSLVCDATGRTFAGLAAFRPDQRVVTLPERTQESPAANLDPTFAQDARADMFDALVLGLRDYAHKSGFRRALIALSGGIDSAVVAVIAAAAFGPENIIGVSLPSSISSQHSKDDARILAANLGIRFETITIADAVAACETSLAPLFAGCPRDVAEENIQARVRGVLMMALSNKFGSLLLTTGNKSEMAVGYCTLYGDMCGGLAVISDVFKMQVYAFARWINRDREISSDLHHRETTQRGAAAEPDRSGQPAALRTARRDPEGLRRGGLSRRDLVARGFPEAVVNDVTRKVDLNEYKRKQAAPGLKITPLAFGVGRRIPIVQRYVS
jgi:NAD+ synthase (glutamine-hydrolysing)